jgi:hypothetical protein
MSRSWKLDWEAYNTDVSKVFVIGQAHGSTVYLNEDEWGPG